MELLRNKSPDTSDKVENDRLSELRAEMTAATEVFVNALNARGEIALAIAEEKRRRGLNQIRDLDRERDVLDLAESVNHGPFCAEAVRRVLQVAMDVSSELQASTTELPLGDAQRQPA